MEIRFTQHALDRMSEPDRMISRADVERALTQPDAVVTGPTEVKYDRVVDGRPIRVVVVPGSDPPLVITVMVVRT